MATNLLIGVPSIPSAITVSNTASTIYPVTNLFGGTKVDSFRLATPTSGDTLLTTTVPTQTSNFFYLGKANTLRNNNVGTITVKGHSANNYAAATTIHTASSFTSASLVGPDNDDYIATFATTASYPFYFVNYNASAASRIAHAKMFLGNAIDPGKDPTGKITSTRIKDIAGRRRSSYSFSITWEGVAYAKAVEMYQKLYRPRRYQPVILFTNDYHDLLFGHRVLFGRVTDMTVPPRETFFCDVTMTFDEVQKNDGSV